MGYNLISIARSFHPPKDYVIFQQHKGKEIVYYLDGKGKTTIEDRTYEYEEHSIAIIEAGHRHDELMVEQGEVIFCIFEMEEELGSQVIKDIGGRNKKVLELLMKIEEELMYKSNHYEELIKLYLKEIVILLSRLVSKDRKILQVVECTKKVIQNNYGGDIHFDILAEKLGYSYDRLRHIFKEEVGKSLNQYLIDERIQQAKRYLVQSNENIYIIGKRCGFKDQSHFIKTFRIKVGISPAKYREVVGNDNQPVVNFETYKNKVMGE